MRPLHRARAILGLLFLSDLISASATKPRPGADSVDSRAPRAIVFVTVDTLRADTLSHAGYPLPTTPFLDRIASEGISFSRAYSTSSWTPPTMASIFTGMYPSTHGVVSGEISERRILRQPILPESLTTIAEAAKRTGYTTLGVASNRHLAKELGFAQGFDRFYDPPSFEDGATVNAEARRLLAQEFGPDWPTAWRSRPLLLWLHYFDPHDPYVPYPPWLARFPSQAPSRGALSPARTTMRELKRRFPTPDADLARAIRPFYDGEVHRTDRLIESLWNELAPDDDVLFVFTADHGEEIADHGGLGHSQSLYEELVRAPLLLHWPRGLPAGVRIETPVSLIDLLPTLLDLLGAAPEAALQGRSLTPLWRPASAGELPTPSPAGHPPVFLELHPPKPLRLAMVEGSWKLIVDPADRDAVELYDLASDPGEVKNLATAERSRVAAMQESLRAWVRALPKAADTRILERSDEELIEQLKALGYLDG